MMQQLTMVANGWKAIPWWLRGLALASGLVLGGAELGINLNHALNSGSIFGGQGAQGAAQVRDPVQTRARMNAGQPVSGAERMITVQYEKEDAAAREQMASAAAATESPRELRALDERGEASSTEALRLRELDLKENDILLRRQEIALRQAEAAEKAATARATNESLEDLLGKKARGIPLTSAENLKLQELRSARAEATIKESQAYSAPSQAEADKLGADFASGMLRSMMGNGGGFDMRRLQNNILNGRWKAAP
jgi:hypothetical protein